MPRGKRRYSSYPFLTLALDGGEWSVSFLSHAWSPGKDPPIHWIGGWVGLRAGLDTRLEEKSFASAGDKTPIVQYVVSHYTDWSTTAPKLSPQYLLKYCMRALNRLVYFVLIVWLKQLLFNLCSFNLNHLILTCFHTFKTQHYGFYLPRHGILTGRLVLIEDRNACRRASQSRASAVSVRKYSRSWLLSPTVVGQGCSKVPQPCSSCSQVQLCASICHTSSSHSTREPGPFWHEEGMSGAWTCGQTSVSQWEP
jgi:hypothetical protein